MQSCIDRGMRFGGGVCGVVCLCALFCKPRVPFSANLVCALCVVLGATVRFIWQVVVRWDAFQLDFAPPVGYVDPAIAHKANKEAQVCHAASFYFHSCENVLPA